MKLRLTSGAPTFAVRSERSGRTYQVARVFTEWRCSCPAGRHKGKCRHLDAVRRWLDASGLAALLDGAALDLTASVGSEFASERFHSRGGT